MVAYFYSRPKEASSTSFQKGWSLFTLGPNHPVLLMPLSSCLAAEEIKGSQTNKV